MTFAASRISFPLRLQPFKKVVLILLILTCQSSLATGQSFYKNPNGLFSTRPNEKTSLQSIDRFGPVGIGIELLQSAFVMRIKNVEPGSPAEKTGLLKKGQIIESINGQTLKDIDPRIQVGQILAKAEATDGQVKLAIQGLADPVVVKIPVLGAYSETWPLNCPKSDKIVRQVAEYLSSPKSNKGLAGIGMLFLLSTGDEKDLEVVRQWARKAPAHTYPWYVGYGGLPLAECYLRTGDEEILANIQKWVDSAVRTQHNDAWAGRGSALTGYGAGHLNAAGTHVLTFLLLAKECGADVPDHTLLGALRHFYRYVGRGGNPYGDDRPGGGFVDNGKNGKLAFAMAAAAALTPDGENSVYAQARDMSAMYSFYSTSFMLHGHTGGGIGEIWRSAAMGLLHEKKPKQYREFMDNRQWHYDLSRRFDGSFGILGGAGYDKEQWGVAYPLAYTIPRKTLRIAGAPRTKYSKTYQLPKQPWGTEADNRFLSLQPVAGSEGSQDDLSGETLSHDSSMHFLRRFHGKTPTDDEIRKYIQHPEHNIRIVAASKAVGINYGYIGRKDPGGKVRPSLVNEFIQHKDPRVRRAIFSALLSREPLLTPDIMEFAFKAIHDQNESWWVKESALNMIGRAKPDQILPHVDLLIEYLDHEEAWLQRAALTALTPVVADSQCYKKVIPAIGELLQSNQRVSITLGLAPAIRAKIKSAGPEVQELARQTLQSTFTGYAGTKVAPGGLNTTSTHDYHLQAIAASLAEVPGGYDVLYRIAKHKYPDEILPYKEIFLAADASQFGPELRMALKPIILNELIPEYVGRNRKRLKALAAHEVSSEWIGGRGEPMDGLAALHERAGCNEFQWKMFADLRNEEWSYHSFDPIASEQVPFDQLITRYRPVTLPEGMENWFAIEFDPDQAGWKKGQSPFGNDNGKLPERPITKCSPNCVGPGCFGATKVNTLWEKEVLLMRGTFKLPAIKDGYRYRLRVNNGDHVGSGGGYLIYVNGKRLIECKQGRGRGAGGRPKGALVTKEFLDDLKSGEVTIAIKTFIRYNAKYSTKPRTKVPQGKISIHLDEQKLPPTGDDLIFKSAAVVRMTSSEWQSKLDPEDASQNPDENLFRWNGQFSIHPRIKGTWKLVSQVKTLEEFDPTRKARQVRNAPFATLSFNEGGKTSLPTWAWSGDTLMDLDHYQALKMQVRKVADREYLFIESGGFSNRHKPGWKSSWYVLER